MLTLVQAATPKQIAQARELFLEYSDWLGFDLSFQNFQQELAQLPGAYAPPSGRLLLALDPIQEAERGRSIPAGCVALRRISDEICEMKRLYLRSGFRGRGVGRKLAEAIIAEARSIGYKRMRLDTIQPKMQDALLLYRSLGFREIAPYRENPIPGAMYMELELKESVG